MSNDSFDLKVFTPIGLAVEDQASQVTLPSKDGEVGILPGHIGYAGLLGTGILEYYSTESKSAVRLVVAEGFCSFSESGLSILADSVAKADEVDKETYGETRAELHASLKEGDTRSTDWQRAKVELEKIEAIDRLISH
jgi:F-type H+-transporting ATPase subunit epsilon